MKIEIYYDILNYIKEIIKGTEFEGHVFSVGGCERDKHLGLRTIKDIDIVIDLMDGGIKFAKWLESNGHTHGSVVVYENFGTAMFKLDKFPKEEIEAVHTRKETYRDKNSRNPETAFGTINDDCLRRDFTINSLYHNISTEEDLDLTGNGLLDLEEGFIKTCSSPDIIFTDDPLRIMRAIRFSSKLGFRIDDDVLKGMKDNAERLKIISQERITDEFNKILTSINPFLGLRYLDGIKFFDIITPYLFKTEKGKIDAFNAIYEFQDNEKYKLETALAVFLKSWYSGDSNRNLFLHNFKYSNDMIKIVNLYSSESWHVELACALNLPNKVREIIHKCATVEDFENIVAIAKATRNIGPRSDGREIFDVLNDIDVPEMIGYKLPINGDDIMETLQIGPSPLIKKVFDVLIEEAYNNPKITREECLAIVEEFKPGTEFIDTKNLTGNSLTLKK